MEYTQAEILQTVRMTEMEHLDVRTVTLGISLQDCATDSVERTAERVRAKIERVGGRLVETVDRIGEEMGIRIANKRISITPASHVAGAARNASDCVKIARAIDEAAARVGVDLLGGYYARVHKGWTDTEKIFLDSIPQAHAT
ncbi:MAG: uncharacterized protein QOE33_1251, partial [Acidobacteriota bacterium]|nr:uncharacterized protein [Acidobacteriota bacterium]